ncbi:MAG: hypothetical protein ACRD1Y_09380 [Terriglobales bacterium]
MKVVNTILRQWQIRTCSHHWVRARWDDGTYGLRCSRCMAAYTHTWDDIIGQETAGSAASAISNLHRAA